MKCHLAGPVMVMIGFGMNSGLGSIKTKYYMKNKRNVLREQCIKKKKESTVRTFLVDVLSLLIIAHRGIDCSLYFKLV